MKNQRGITLIALVITIIVLIITTSISINLVLGDNGIIGNARRASEEYERATLNEKEQLNTLHDQLISEITPITYTAYTVGQTVTLGTGDNAEDFYVIEDSDESKSTVKLLSANCVNPSDNYKQGSGGNFETLAFDSTEPYTNVYADSTIITEVANYKVALEERTEKRVQQARLMSLDEKNYLTGNGYNGIVYGTTVWLYYWLDTPTDATVSAMGYVANGTRPSSGNAGVMNSYGLRPVIIISKTEI